MRRVEPGAQDSAWACARSAGTSFQPSARRALGIENLAIAKPVPMASPHSFNAPKAPVYAATADGLPRASFARNSATKSQIAEGLVFGSKAGNKPVKDGS